MNKNISKATACAVLLSFPFGSSSCTQSSQAGAAGSSDGNTAFALDLYGQLKSTEGNLFFSPFSISTCLAMTYAGARGETEKQMGAALHFDADQKSLHASFTKLQNQLIKAGNQKGTELNIANALWTQQGEPLSPAFLKYTEGYQANVSQADFKRDANGARLAVNRWVEQKTKDKIKDLLPPGSVDAATRLILANAIYFKGMWVKAFKKDATHTQPFHVTARHQIDVPLMYQMEKLKYMEDPGFQAVELPYNGDALTMVILLPRAVDGCSKLEDRLTPLLLADVFKELSATKVQIFLPRFKLESSFNLVDPLSHLGMPNAFGSTADFSGIDGSRDLFISGVFHKAWGEVNEEGTEAAAATAVVVTRAIAENGPPPPPVFRADHPFIFLIRDSRSGSILFLGRLSNPAS